MGPPKEVSPSIVNTPSTSRNEPCGVRGGSFCAFASVGCSSWTELVESIGACRRGSSTRVLQEDQPQTDTYIELHRDLIKDPLALCFRSVFGRGIRTTP